MNLIPSFARVLATCLILFLAPLAVAQTQEPSTDTIVTLRDGREIYGQFVDATEESVTLLISGIETTFPRSQIAEIQRNRSLRDEYQNRRAQLEEGDTAGRFQLARWLYEQGSPEAYRLAAQELDAVLNQAPSHEQAQILSRIIRERLRLLEAQQQQAANRIARTESAGPARPRGRISPEMLLNEDQINLLRVYEIDLEDRPRIVVPNEAIDAFLEAYRGHPALTQFAGRAGMARFRNLPGYRQLDLMFQTRAREFYDDVIIRDEPMSMRLFRTRIQPTYIYRYCGRCHTNGEAPGLYLFTGQANPTQLAYTNFLILNRTSVNNQPLIDRDNPRLSPLAQYGLPQTEATYPHPAVRGWRAYFTGPNDPRFDALIEWIDSLYTPTPQYPIRYTPPQAGQANQNRPSQPRTRPASPTQGANPANP